MEQEPGQRCNPGMSRREMMLVGTGPCAGGAPHTALGLRARLGGSASLLWTTPAG